MYKELAKYMTGTHRPCFKTELHQNNSTAYTITYEEYEYVIPLGDLMNDFINHKTMSWWKKPEYYDQLTELYIKILNQETINHWL